MASSKQVVEGEVISQESTTESHTKKPSKKTFNPDQIKRSVYDFYEEYGHLVLGSIFSAIALYILRDVAVGIIFGLLGVLFITGYFKEE